MYLYIFYNLKVIIYQEEIMFQGMDYIYAVYEEGSFSKAAENCLSLSHH